MPDWRLNIFVPDIQKHPEPYRVPVIKISYRQEKRGKDQEYRYAVEEHPNKYQHENQQRENTILPKSTMDNGLRHRIYYTKG